MKSKLRVRRKLRWTGKRRGEPVKTQSPDGNSTHAGTCQHDGLGPDLDFVYSDKNANLDRSAPVLQRGFTHNDIVSETRSPIDYRPIGQWRWRIFFIKSEGKSSDDEGVITELPCGRTLRELSSEGKLSFSGYDSIIRIAESREKPTVMRWIATILSLGFYTGLRWRTHKIYRLVDSGNRSINNVVKSFQKNRRL